MSPIPMPRRTARRLRVAVFPLLFVAACADDRDEGRTTAIGVLGVTPVMTRSEYMAMPDSVRLDVRGDDGSFGTERGVAVEVEIRLDGYEGVSVPFTYALHHAGNGLPLLSVTTSLVPDTPRWHRRGRYWLSVPGSGSYYARVTLNDSTGRNTSGPRTADFTVP